MAQSRPGVELLSVDSMQVYRGMDVGTAKATPAERASVPHHLIDVAEPDERWTVTRFAAAARQALATIEARGATAVLVGGTGLYVQAVLGDLDPPGEWPDVRARVSGWPAGEAYARLLDVDPAAAGKIEPGNGRRIVRALEVTLGSGRPFSSFGPGVGTYPPTPRFQQVGVWLPRRVVAARIGARVAAMAAAGLVEEVQRLAPTMGPTARQALGYKEVLAHLDGGGELGLCLDEVVRRTRSFARRQRTWFRRDPRVRWHGTASDPMRLLPGLLVELDACLDPPPPEGG
jgi:tRNA dimethylallyltransferase